MAGGARASMAALVLAALAVIPAMGLDAVVDRSGDRTAPRLLWSRHAGRSYAVTPLLLPGKVILAATDAKVVCLDLKNGERDWARVVKEPVSAPPAATSDSPPEILLAEGSREGRVHAWNLRDGKERWAMTTSTPVIGLIARGDRCWLLEKGGRIGCRAVADGRELWHSRFGSWDPAGFVSHGSDSLPVDARSGALQGGLQLRRQRP